ncbi:myb-like DNA-binding domain-containing protein [Hirsutella rhossiliensis]|uniref:Vacuolar import and degradation protein 21 n=1 Tax=Hirsutella rhossiliensis TaxID=111463 RepID=A0A9P8MRX4_9HYPO|nr:myb-like DNA-binding domain-containing protein [Hirsutella rhossiliensis]KAH0959096.1 myb-like DNA-binding domain-containing protein [Hirsutella rhossiliensis]
MTEVGYADLSRILQSRRNECSAIVTSRKRKLRELFAVASQVDPLPDDGFANPDAPAATPAEWQFLQASDILQGKALNELNIPSRPRMSLERMKRLVAESVSAATGCALLDAPGSIARKDSSEVRGEAQTPDAALAKNAPVVATAGESLSPASLATPTPMTQPREPSLPVTPDRPAEAAPKPAATSKPPTKDAGDAATPRPNGEPNGVAKGDSATKRHTQVKFPPGTKGSPSEDAASNAPTSLHSGDASVNGALDVEAINAAAKDNGPLSIKLPADPPRVPDAVSTPGSTAPSAATPAVHDASTDTSPERDGPRYSDVVGRKGSAAGNEAGSPASVTDVQDQGSIRTSEEITHADMGRLAVTKDIPKSTPTLSEPERHSSSSAVRPPSTEVPDSHEETPDAMDLDAHEVKPEVLEQAILSPNPQPREQAQNSERPVTRVSSGAMRLKSVTEILTPVTSTPQSPASRARHSGTARRDRVKNHASTVLFGKQPKRVDDKALVPGHKETFQASDDYYTPLFVQNFTGSSKWMQPLERILFQANKTISTPDAHLVIQDHQACRVLRRVYHLQQHDKWSLRQPKRCPEPTRPPSHWDLLLQEMKWMRTDFREERKWKRAVARNLAYACAEWHEASPEERKYLQVEAAIPLKAQVAEQDTPMVDVGEGGLENQPTPDLVSSGDVESPRNVDDLVEDFVETVAPSAIFALQEGDVVFGLRRTAASDKLLEELPMYGSPLKVPKSDMSSHEFDPDAHWRRLALPLSKYVEGEMKLAANRPPQKRSRYDYENEDDDDDDKNGQFVRDQLVHSVKLPPQTGEVALFNPESKHIRDRLHAGHQFRPPSEHTMPTQSFYESRSPSQWTVAEDDELRGLVREYSYNWSLISSMLSTKSSFAAGAERRTPWECFERWINLEGLPADMQKTQYFKAYNSRIEAAQRVIAQQNQLAAQQASASGGAVTPIRRRPSIPLRVERRRNQKHLTMLDAMRKLAKKRETAIQKQQHSASQNSANKKTNDAMSQRPAKTPRDYSLMRWERDQALAEKMAQYAQRQEAQRRAAMQARVQAQAAQATGAPGAGMPGQNANHPGANPSMNGAARPMSSQLAAAAAAVAAGQNRPRMPMQAPANGVAPTQMDGTPQTQVQATQGQHRLAMPNQQPDASLMLRAQRISEQQRAAQQQQQQQGNPGTPGGASQHNSPPLRNGINGLSQQTFMNNAQAMMASYAAAATNGNSVGATQANGLHMPSAATTPSPGQRAHPQLPPAIAVQLSHMETNFRAKNPNLTSEQARQLATEHLTRAMMAQRQNAMNAAAGSPGQAGIASSIAGTTSPHQYAALLRQQQQQQQQQQGQQPPKAQQHQQQRQQVPQQKPPAPTPPQQQQPQFQQHVATKGSTPVPPVATPVAASASPVQSQQRAPSGSATPSAVGK